MAFTMLTIGCGEEEKTNLNTNESNAINAKPAGTLAKHKAKEAVSSYLNLKYEIKGNPKSSGTKKKR